MYLITYARPGEALTDEVEYEHGSAAERYRELAKDDSLTELSISRISVDREIQGEELKAMLG